jgi:glycopeptide antibiotics resistance protein
VRFFEGVYRQLLPWFLPGTAISVVVGLVVARPLGRWLRTNYWVAWGVVVGFGMIVSATLTPLHGSFNFEATMGTCDLSRMGLASVRDLLRMGDTSLNVFLFIPLGFAIGLLGRSRQKAIVLGLAIGLPFVIETTQLLLPMLDRGCQSADVFDNLTGLVVGLLVSTLIRLLFDSVALDSGASPADSDR